MFFLFVFIFLTFLFFIYSYMEAQEVKIKEILIFTKKLKKDISILHISDLHFHKFVSKRKFFNLTERLKNFFDSNRPDFVFFTGDYIDDESGLILLKELLKIIPPSIKIYGVLGNHDYFHYNILHIFYPLFSNMDRKPQDINSLLRVLDENRVIVLQNEMKVEKESIDIYGIDFEIGKLKYPHGLDFSDNNYKILLSHYPDIIKKVAGKVDLVLSGHTHGGQITFFGFPVILRSKIERKWARGLSEHNDTLLFVSEGVGESFYIPLRFFSAPSMAFIKIKGGDKYE